MDAIVSARVPIALKERGNGILHDIGSTPTQLINAAYQFVLAEHELPKPHDPLEGMRGAKRELTDEQALELSRKLSQLKRREMACIVHYDGEAYVTARGLVSDIDLAARTVTVVRTRIPLDDIADIRTDA